MLFRLYFKEQGGHTHVQVYAGTGPLALGNCGELVFRNEEWAAAVREIDWLRLDQPESLRKDASWIEVLPAAVADPFPRPV